MDRELELQHLEAKLWELQQLLARDLKVEAQFQERIYFLKLQLKGECDA